MKFITKIQSFSDVITNSSSEVFLMSEANAEYYHNLENTNGCISIEEITWNWLENHSWEWQMVCDYLDIDKSLVGEYHESQTWKGYGYWSGPEEEDWLTFLDIYKDKIEEKIIGLYFVDIEDHFEDAYEVTEEARDDSYWSDSRH